MGTAATFDYTRISAAAVSVLRDAFDQVAVETEQGSAEGSTSRSCPLS